MPRTLGTLTSACGTPTVSLILSVVGRTVRPLGILVLDFADLVVGDLDRD